MKLAAIKKQIKDADNDIEQRQEEMFNIVTMLFDSGKISTKTYIDASDAIHNMNNVFRILKENKL